MTNFALLRTVSFSLIAAACCCSALPALADPDPARDTLGLTPAASNAAHTTTANAAAPAPQPGTTTTFDTPGPHNNVTTGALPVTPGASKDKASSSPDVSTPTAATPGTAATAPATPSASEAAAPAAPAAGTSTAGITPSSSEDEATGAPSTTSAPAAAAPASPAPVAAAPTPPPADPVVVAIRQKLSDASNITGDVAKADVAALTAFYDTHSSPLWVTSSGFNAKGKSILAELGKAEDWGLESKDFAVASPPSGASTDQLAEADVAVSLAAMKYARFARGGRLSPLALSNILDMNPPVADPKDVIKDLAAAGSPDAYLRGMNPKHEQFEKLRQALLKARGPKQEEEKIDPALLVKLPDGKQLKPGAESDEVALLRKRLSVAAEDKADELRYDEKLQAAVKEFQSQNGIKANGIVSNRTRQALNSEGEPKKVDPSREIDRILVNMERWRWLPTDLGRFYVLNNIPEFSSEIWKAKELVLKQKMIVGQPSWPTPVMIGNMQYVITHPSWGMPDGIKAKELAPRLRQASGSGFDLLDALFGGGGNSGGARVLQAYKLQAYYNGRPVDGNSVNWKNVDVRRYSFTQPPGPDNPLGIVKFRFPNRHDVYMHDTPQRELFGQTYRALSHGCLRVEQPKRTAEVILAEEKGMSSEQVDDLFRGGNEVTLDKPMPVYLVYFTARVDNDGRLLKYADLYGHDDRIMSALRGKPVRYTAPEAVDENPGDPQLSSPSDSQQISNAADDDALSAPPAKKKNTKQAKQQQKKKQPQTAGDVFLDALGGAFLN